MKDNSNIIKTDLIKRYATAQTKAFVEKSKSIKSLKHSLVKGMLRELFVTDVLRPFLGSQFSLGSGIIINQMSDQSHQNDIIILNNHILPPFIGEQSFGVYPLECVVGTIEVKSNLRKKCLEKAEKDARYLKETLYRDRGTKTPTILRKPFSAIFGFYGSGKKELLREDAGKKWLNENVWALNAICLSEKYCWINKSSTHSSDWSLERGNDTNEEIKRFLAIIVDYTRYLAQTLESNLKIGPQDWISAYIR
jgi:hypothetical protein